MLGRKQFESYFSFAIERNPWDAVVSLYHWRYRDSEPGGSFRDYVVSDAVETFATKNQRIYRIKGEVAVDRVLRYESLADELARGLDAAGRSPASPSCRTPRPARPLGAVLPDYYDDASRPRVATLFAAPIAGLGYTVGPTAPAS